MKRALLCLAAACGGRQTSPPTGHANATATERDAPATDLSDPFARILAGAPLDHVCFAATADRTRVACATGSWDRQLGARFAIEVVGARSTRWDYSTFDGPGYADGATPAPIDRDQLGRAKHQLETDGFTAHLELARLEDKPATVGSWHFERAGYVLVRCGDQLVPATPKVGADDTIEVAALAGTTALVTVDSHTCNDSACSGARLALVIDARAICGH